METILKILARVPADKFVNQAIALIEAGEMPSADLLHRCGIRANLIVNA